MKKSILLIGLTLAMIGCYCEKAPSNSNMIQHSSDLTFKDPYTLVGKRNFISDYPAVDKNGDINAVIEIPTGTNGKWEVNKSSGNLEWEFKKGKPRIVKYLGYPGNYGMIPSTLLSKESGGDGVPLDVLILGPAVPRGSVLKIRLIGVMKMLDDGEKDDKLLAVLLNSPLGAVMSIDELNQKFNGITNIIETWFANYKGPGEIQTKGFSGSDEAMRVLNKAVVEFKAQEKSVKY